MKRVFIAGATGYLGRYLVNEFGAQGWEVHALCRTSPDTPFNSAKSIKF